MEQIAYYFIEKTSKDNILSYIGKNNEFLSADCDWWDIKEYGFLDKKKAEMLVKRYNQTKDYKKYKIKEIKILFETKLDKLYFIDRFIKPYYKDKTIQTILGA